MLLISHRLREWNRRFGEKTDFYVRGRWYRALLLCRVISAFQAAGLNHGRRNSEHCGNSDELISPAPASNMTREDPMEREKETLVQILSVQDHGDSPFGCFALTPSSTDISQSAGTTSPSKTLIEKQPRRRRCFSKQEKERINQVRKTGACQSCRRKRRKVRS